MVGTMLRLCSWVLAALGCVLAGIGLACLGGDWAQGAVRTLAEHWRALHPASFATLAPSGVAAALDWPAPVLVPAGALLAWLARPRPVRSPALPPHAVPLAAQLRRRDLSKTLAYLESQRDWPQRSSRGEER
jgi:hypothetical protein